MPACPCKLPLVILTNINVSCDEPYHAMSNTAVVSSIVALQLTVNKCICFVVIKLSFSSAGQFDEPYILVSLQFHLNLPT